MFYFFKRLGRRVRKVKNVFVGLLCAVVFSYQILGNDRDSPLCLAVKARNVAMINKLIDNHVDLDFKNAQDKTALHCAVEDKSIEIVKILIKAGADVDVQACYGWTPLHWAVYVDSSEIVRLLLRAGADINAENNYDYNALGLAVYYNRVDIAQDLIRSGASLSYCGGSAGAVWSVCKDGRIAMLKVLVDLYHVDLDDQNSHEHDWTPLHLAVYKDQYNIAAILVMAGACRTIKDRNGFLAIDYAQNQSMVALLQR